MPDSRFSQYSRSARKKASVVSEPLPVCPDQPVIRPGDPELPNFRRSFKAGSDIFSIPTGESGVKLFRKRFFDFVAF